MSERVALFWLWTWLLDKAVEFSRREPGFFDVEALQEGDELVLRIRRVSPE